MRREKKASGIAATLSGGTNLVALGSAIRRFRLRRKQFHNGKPWALEDLAAAIDGDKAHVSRIESGGLAPNRSTLMRIGRALDLSRADSEYLLRLGGFASDVQPPTEQDVKVAIKWLAATSRSYPLPFTLYSLDARVWYANALWLRLAGMTPQQFRCCFVGRSVGESYFDPCCTVQLLRARYHDFERQQRRTVARFYRAACEGRVSAESVARALADPHMRQLWCELEASGPDQSISGEQGTAEYRYPGRGLLRFDTWICPMQVDPRFAVILHVPRDPETRASVMEIRRERRPREGPPCPIHGYRGAAVHNDTSG